MIVSHKHRFIFLKTRKTAGTSLEIALSEYCGPDDIISRIRIVDEPIRAALGYRGPQYYHVPFRRYTMADWHRAIRSRERLRYRNHDPASVLKRRLGDYIWENYFKFTFVRDPYDLAISRYHWAKRKGIEPTLSDYLKKASAPHLTNWNIYTIDDRIAVDFVGRYETLQEDLATIWERIGLPGPPSLPRAKSGFRPTNREADTALSSADRHIIDRVCRREIETFGYSRPD